VVHYEINGNAYDKSYYLAGSIYPSHATLAKTIRDPQAGKEKRFSNQQEICRKDVELAFGVLHSKPSGLLFVALLEHGTFILYER
jgi:hypothetical protein